MGTIGHGDSASGPYSDGAWEGDIDLSVGNASLGTKDE